MERQVEARGPGHHGDLMTALALALWGQSLADSSPAAQAGRRNQRQGGQGSKRHAFMAQ
jgi:hypothetical protein